MNKKRFFCCIFLLIPLLSSCQSFMRLSATATSVSPTDTVTPTSTLTPIPLTSTPMPVPPTATPVFGVGSTIVSEKDGMVMVYVPAGEFTMGSNMGESKEQPVHMVYLDAFWIDQTEVTNGMYAECVDDGQCKPPSPVTSFTRGRYYGEPDFDNYPLIHISWEGANTYCSWAVRRLPTEAEWEKAASWNSERKTKSVYPWGNDIDCSFLNYWDEQKGCGVGDTSPVGSYESGKSPYGAYDMAGNVYEWVNDWYSETYYSISPSRNPLGPDTGESRVIRGGAWSFYEEQARSTFRTYNYDDPALFSSVEVGFRCAMSASK